MNFYDLGKSSNTDTHTITIEWIRHGEACTNLFDNFAEDEYLDLEKQNDELNSEKYLKFKKNYEDSEIITKLDTAEPVKTDLASTASLEDWFSIKKLFKNYKDKEFMITDKNNVEIDNLSYSQLELQIDYQKFRRELLAEEELNLQTLYSDKTSAYTSLLEEMLNKAYTNNYGIYDPKNKTDAKDKDNKKIIDAIRMIEYNKEREQFTKEQKVNKTENPQKMFSTWMFMPTLSFVGVKQCEFVGKNYLKNKFASNSYDLILTSATVRTIMTALISVYNALKDSGLPESPKEIIISPFINEEYNGASIINGDFSNIAIPSGIIDVIIAKIMGWIIQYDGNKYSDIDNYVKINSDIYKKYTSKLNYTSNSNNLDKFLNDFIPKKLNTAKNNLSILAYTHGNFINARREENAEKYTDIKNKKNPNGTYEFNKLSPFPNNLSTWIESYNWDLSKYIPNNDMTRYNSIYDNPNFNLFFPEGYNETNEEHKKLKQTKTACRGSTIRKELLVTPIEELENLLSKDNFSSLIEGSLRGDINIEWFKWLETEEGKMYNPLIVFNDKTKLKIKAEELFNIWITKSIPGKNWLASGPGQIWLSSVKGKVQQYQQRLRNLGTSTVGGFVKHKYSKKSKLFKKNKSMKKRNIKHKTMKKRNMKRKTNKNKH